MSVKVYLHYEGSVSGAPEKTSKISIPKSWVETKTVADVIELFAKGYNDKNPEHRIVTAEMHLEDSERQSIFSNVICGTVLFDHSDYYIRLGECVQGRAREQAAADSSLVRCKNYGCGQLFSPELNEEGSCCHHVSPPVFHDTAKYWSCCKDKKAYDFESFQEIRGCTLGRHSEVNRGVTISASPNATVAGGASASGAAAAGEEAAQAPVLKSIADFNTSNPTAATSEQAAIKAVTRKSSRIANSNAAKCQRKGCQREFVVSENHGRACVFHGGQPIFHDALKFWSCCPDKKKMDFDEFLAVPGCCLGYHDDGELDEELLGFRSA